MEAVVLIGGKGTRLRPITYAMPKAMMPLRNKAYIHYPIEPLRAVGLSGSVRWVTSRAQYKGTSPGKTSTGDRCRNQPCALSGLDFAEVVEAHQISGVSATITLAPVEDPTAFSSGGEPRNGRPRSAFDKG